MKSFKQYNVVKIEEVNQLLEKEVVSKEPIAEPTEGDKAEDTEQKDSEIGEWIKVKNGWVVRFIVNGVDYSVSFWPVDENELHWNFVYFKTGQRDSSDIKKFGEPGQWKEIWTVLVEILKDFIRIFHPETIKFVGMSISKRGIHYKDLFKMYIKDFRNAFRKLGHHSSFDHRNISQAPSFVIKKGNVKEAEPEKEETKRVEEEKLGYLGVDYELVTTLSDRRIFKGPWIQPEKYRKAGDDGKYIAYNVEFLDPKTHKYDGASVEARYKDEVSGMKWARTVRHPPEMTDDYVKTYGTASE